MVEKLVADGDVHSAEWRAALSSVPRHEFVPRYYRQDAGVDARKQRVEWELVEPTVDLRERAAWLDLVYSDTTLVTAVADYVGRGVRIPVSSSTKPDLMVRMLEALEVADGHRVLEIGTGTGYNAALLSHRLGAENVCSVDVDPVLVADAAARLAGTGFHPVLAAVDGSAGLPGHGPFDRIIATCSVSAVPLAWIEQLGPDGRILVDVEGPLGAGNLVALRRRGADLAVSGRFLPWWGRFMRLRTGSGPAVGAAPARRAPGPPRRTTTRVDPAELDQGFRFLVQLYVPAGTRQSLRPSADLTRPVATTLVAPDGSWCDVGRDPDPEGRYPVESGGAQELWAGVETAWEPWSTHGCPAWSEFGLTVTRGGHTVWLREPDGPSWALPTGP